MRYFVDKFDPMAYYLNMALQRLKNWTLPIAMVIGVIFHDFFAQLAFLTPYLIFVMLLAPYSRLSFSRIRLGKLHLSLLAVQLLGAVAVYGLLRLFDPIVAQGVFICVFVPTATSAAVIAGMLGGSVTTLATFCLISNFTVAMLSPVVFSFVGENVTMPFLASFGRICHQMLPLLVLPFLIVLTLKRFAPKAHKKLQGIQPVSFYLWAIALTIVIGNTVNFVLVQQPENYRRGIWIAGLALVVCVAQFLIGRRIGRRYANRIAGGQGLGQKNTVLAIWMAQSYLNPLASIGPASYVIWQNAVNSWQLWRARRAQSRQSR